MLRFPLVRARIKREKSKSILGGCMQTKGRGRIGFTSYHGSKQGQLPKTNLETLIIPFFTLGKLGTLLILLKLNP